jgi:hypothetical protein
MRRSLFALALAMTAALPAFSQEVTIVSHEERSLVLSVTAPIPVLIPHAARGGSVEPRIEGTAILEEGGRPRIPYSRTLIGVPEGMRPVLSILSARQHRISDDRIAVTLHPAFGLTAAEGWEEPAEPPLPKGRYPRKAAEIAWTGWLRDAQVAEIRFYPVRSAGEGGGILHLARIVARVDFVPDAGSVSPRRHDDEAPSISSPEDEAFHEIQRRALLNADRVVPPPMPAPSRPATRSAPIGAASSIQGSSPAPLKISVNSDGLYRITPADLTAAGVSPASVNPLNFRVENGGIPVPVEVLGEGDGSFDPNDRIVFYGRAATGRYTRNNVYWLYFDASSTRAAQRSGAFGSPATTPASFLTTVHAEQDLIYTQNPPTGAIDHWWWKLQSAGDPNTQNLAYSVSLPNVDPAPHSVNVRVNLQGRTVSSINPDHHTRIFLNGTQIDDRTWDGQIPFTHSVTVSSSLLLTGANSVQVVMVGDTGASVDQVYSNFIEIDYRQTYAAISNALVSKGQGAGSFKDYGSRIADHRLRPVHSRIPGYPRQRSPLCCRHDGRTQGARVHRAGCPERIEVGDQWRRLHRDRASGVRGRPPASAQPPRVPGKESSRSNDRRHLRRVQLRRHGSGRHQVVPRVRLRELRRAGPSVRPPRGRRPHRLPQQFRIRRQGVRPRHARRDPVDR